MRVSFNLTPDLDIDNDITLSTVNASQSYTSIYKGTTKPIHKYATMEPDYTVLDGSKEIMPNASYDLGVWSEELSGDLGTFAKPLKITYTLAKQVSFSGITILGNATSILLNYYRSGATVYSQSHEIQGDIIEAPGVNIDAVEVTITKVTAAYRYAKISYIGLGIEYLLGDNEISSCTVCEEINPVSEELPAGYCDISLVDDSGRFDLLSDNSILATLQAGQRLSVYDDNNLFFGDFYLQDWSNSSDGELTCRFCNAIGLLDQTMCINSSGLYEKRESGMSGEIPIYYAFTRILNESLLLGLYTLEDSIFNPTTSEDSQIPKDQESHFAIKRVTSREGLLQVLMCSGYIADCSRNSRLVIRTIPETVTEITDVFEGYTVAQTGRLSEVSAVTYKYNEETSTEAREYYSGEVVKGAEYTLSDFCETIYLYVNGQVKGTGDYDWYFTPIASYSSASIKGYPILNTEVKVVKQQTVTGQAETLEVDCGSTDVTQSSNIATRLIAYHNNDIEVNFEIEFDPRVITGNKAKVKLGNTYVSGYVTRQEIDVCAGLSRVTLKGVKV
ncbi:MAG: hypothetical protein Q4A45_03340 [Clostridia bacterium]|nr:hypothetical protein [Clostridia bacterium]